MTDDEDNWVQAAIDDTDLVVEVLLRLRQASPPPPPPPQPPVGWSIRQRRSRPPALLPKKSLATRASPTTPLSWSGATSGSGAGVGNVDCIEESSRPIPNRSGDSRSKVMQSNETTPTKRPRKKKTLAELKEEETTLSKERKQLKRQLATLQAACEKQRKENESLKKMKLQMDLQSLPQGVKPEAVATVEPHQTVAVSDGIESKKENGFVLPDLNIPAGGDE